MFSKSAPVSVAISCTHDNDDDVDDEDENLEEVLIILAAKTSNFFNKILLVRPDITNQV